MHRFIIFIMGSAVVALALAVISISTVAVMAQTMALFSQCVVALVLLTLSGAVGGSLALRQRVIQLYLARRLLGEEADRLLAQPQPDWPKALPEAFSGKQLDQQSSVSPATRLRQVPPLAMPAVPSGWGFDEED